MNCVDCGKQLAAPKKNKRPAERCMACGNRHRGNDPEFQRLRAEGIRRKFQDPEHRAKMAKVITRTAEKARADPEYYARLVRQGHYQYQNHLNSPETRARNRAAVKAAGPKIVEARLSWCPEQYRAEYLRLQRSKRMRAADARAVIEAKIADDQAIKSGKLDDAVFWLNRIAPTKRLDDGRYRYGSAVLTPGELMKRAERKGWQPA